MLIEIILLLRPRYFFLGALAESNPINWLAVVLALDWPMNIVVPIEGG